MNLPAEISGVQQAAGLPRRPLHLAIGMFDGVHRGHRAVIDAAIRAARESGGLAGVLTFWPHPSRLFRPDDPVRLIQSPGLKARMLIEAGVNVVITEPFTPEFARLEAEELLPHLIRHLPGLVTLYVGDNWRFGRGRRGDIQLLIAEAGRHGLTIVNAPRINAEGEPVSSTRIRNCLEEGRLEEANRMLGYAYRSEGTVTAGKRLGRTLGFPTLNLAWQPDLTPRFGVYAVQIKSAGTSGPWLPSVANYGLRPTVEHTSTPRLEVHQLGECRFDEGDEVVVAWSSFLREERKFENVDALRKQIAVDRATAAEFFLR